MTDEMLDFRVKDLTNGEPAFRVLRQQFGGEFTLELIEDLLLLQLLLILENQRKTCLDHGANFTLESCIKLELGDDDLLLASLNSKFFLHAARLFNRSLCLYQGFNHFCFTDLTSTRFDHENAIGRPRHDKIKHALINRRRGWVKHKLTIDFADPYCSDCLNERGVADKKRRRYGVDGQYVRRILSIGGQHIDDDLHFPTEVFGEQRTDRPVDKPRTENLALAGAPFSFIESTRDLPGCIHLLKVVDSQWEEIDSFLCAIADSGCSENDSATHSRQHSSASLLGQSSCLIRYGLACNTTANGLYLIILQHWLL